MLLSSRQLLVLLNELPATSRFKTVAERDGNWTELEQMVSDLHEEISKLRATMHAYYAGEQIETKKWLNPVERVEHRDETEQAEGMFDDFVDQIW